MKKSTLMSVVDVLERVTGLDLDGDGTVGGDVLAEVLFFSANNQVHVSLLLLGYWPMTTIMVFRKKILTCLAVLPRRLSSAD